MRHLQGPDIPPPGKDFKLSQADRITNIRETKSQANLTKTYNKTPMHTCDYCENSAREDVSKLA